MNLNLVNTRPKRTAHLIAEGPDFTSARLLGWPSGKASMGCTCSWSGTVAEWNEHKGKASVDIRLRAPLQHSDSIWRRSLSENSANRRKTHCPQGHPYSPENTRRYPHGARVCVACHGGRAA